MLKAWTTLQTSGRDSEVLSRNRHNNDENEPEESVEAIPDIVVVNQKSQLSPSKQRGKLFRGAGGIG